VHVLITGADGFVGHYLRAELEAHQHEVTCLSGPVAPGGETPPYPTLDLCDPANVDQRLASVQPDACIHLAGLSSSTACEKHPALAMQVNATGTLHLLEALAKHQPKARILLVSTTMVYGTKLVDQIATEESPLRPAVMYAITKAAMEQAATRYAQTHNLDMMIARPENHIGPGQSPQFVVMAFAQQIAEIAAGNRDASMQVGNLDSTRDFSDVRDVVRAYRLLLEKGQPGETYNIATGEPRPIREVLDTLKRLANVDPEIERNEAYWRPTEQAVRVDTSKISTHLGWEPAIPLETSLQYILDSLNPS